MADGNYTSSEHLITDVIDQPLSRSYETNIVYKLYFNKNNDY